MRIQKTLIIFEGDGAGDQRLCDTIEHESRRWLVTAWIDSPTTGKSRPERLVCLDLLQHQKSDGVHYDYLVNYPIPKGVFDGQTQPPSKGIFLVLEDPPIEFETHELLFPES
jgi:hypothetical protein